MITQPDTLLLASVLFSAAVLVGCGFMLFLMKRRCKIKTYASALEHASDFIGNGLMFFDETGRLVSVNTPARGFLPDMLNSDCCGIDRYCLTLQDVLGHFYDMAVDCDQSLINALGRSTRNNDNIGFREVIMASEDRLCLVEAQTVEGVGTNLILIDVGDLRNQEEYMIKLNRYNYELNQAIQAATSGIAVTKPEGGSSKVVFVNKAFCEIFQVSRDKASGQDITDIFRRVHDQHVLDAVAALLAERSSGHAELRIPSFEGGDCWYDLEYTPVYGHAEGSDLSVWLLNDMTALKMREAELSRTQKLEALGQLAAGVAHDFNNVLSIIDGYARLSTKNLDDQKQVRDNLDRIRTASKRGANLIRKMLTFSRHEIVDDTVIDLGAVVREQEVLLQPLLDASIKFNFLSDHQPLYVECPEDNITQIIMNLFVNARDAMPDGGSLLLETRACPQETLPEILLKEDGHQAYASIVVSDTGMGIPDDVLGRIFDPFFTTKQQGKGTGLGLSMVYGLVKQIGGHIDVDSQVGQGTTMTIYMPITDRVPKQASGDINDVSSIRLDGYTVLVAEDEPDLLALVSDMLADLGMNVLQARNGNEALAVQDEYEGTIDLLLTDVVMPEFNGVELAELLKELRPGAKIIFMSGYPAKGQMARVEIPEDAVFITKPIEHEALIKIIYAKLAGYDGQDEALEALHTARWTSKGDIGEGKESVQ
ncbi:MAG: response regulator [Rhodospirillales bacterium]|nr:response regulator [Rhodospirillales bacterium]